MTMKKHLIAVVLVLSMLAAFAGTAAAAPSAVGSVNLVEVQFVWRKGPVFTFSVSGDVSKSDLKGSL
jgi:ABC-type glycerol-3-phosphate transport system substrate-binding protein